MLRMMKKGVSVSHRLGRLSSATSAQSLNMKMAKRSFSTQEGQSLKEVEPVQRGEDYQVRENILRGKNRPAYDLKVGDIIHDAWRVESIERIEFFDINAYQCLHIKTGARHVHLDCQDMDNVFAVLFRTPSDDHTGKPHILEHLATCGSKNYPVRDPFMQMLKRSLNTYMNAWTGSDYTMYPFST